VEFARMDVIDLDQLVVLAVESVVLGLEHTGESFEEVGSLGGTSDVIGGNRFDAGRLREHFDVLLVEAHRLGLRVESNRSGPIKAGSKTSVSAGTWAR